MSVEPMKLKLQDTVILSPKYPHGDRPESPLWGGRLGYLTGQVTLLITHDHDKEKHACRVKWSNGEQGAFQEKYIMLASPEHNDIAKDFAIETPMDEDIGLLYWDGKRYHVAFIECSATVSGKPNFTLLTAGATFLELDMSDTFLVSTFIMQKDMEEHIRPDLFGAMQKAHEYWELDNFKCLPLPLPQAKSIREIAATLNSERKPALARFQLPCRIAEAVATATEFVAK